MFFRRLKNEFKQEIDRNDLKNVILDGLVTLLLYSLMLALINSLLIIFLDMRLSVLIVILSFFLTRQTTRSYEKYHILYSIISVILLLLGLYIFNSISIFAYNQTFEWWYFTESLKVGLIDTLNIFNPMYYISNFNVYELLYLGIIIYSFYFTFKNSKRNY